MKLITSGSRAQRLTAGPTQVPRRLYGPLGTGCSELTLEPGLRSHSPPSHSPSPTATPSLPAASVLTSEQTPPPIHTPGLWFLAGSQAPGQRRALPLKEKHWGKVGAMFSQSVRGLGTQRTHSPAAAPGFRICQRPQRTAQLSISLPKSHYFPSATAWRGHGIQRSGKSVDWKSRDMYSLRATPGGGGNRDLLS